MRSPNARRPPQSLLDFRAVYDQKMERGPQMRVRGLGWPAHALILLASPLALFYPLASGWYTHTHTHTLA